MRVAGLAGDDARWRLLKGWGWLNERIWRIAASAADAGQGRAEL